MKTLVNKIEKIVLTVWSDFIMTLNPRECGFNYQIFSHPSKSEIICMHTSFTKTPYGDEIDISIRAVVLNKELKIDYDIGFDDAENDLYRVIAEGSSFSISMHEDEKLIEEKLSYWTTELENFLNIQRSAVKGKITCMK